MMDQRYMLRQPAWFFQSKIMGMYNTFIHKWVITPLSAYRWPFKILVKWVKMLKWDKLWTLAANIMPIKILSLTQGSLTQVFVPDYTRYMYKLVAILRGCSMATSILHSQNFRFLITVYLEGNWDFLA
jgi:hypothetical protein